MSERAYTVQEIDRLRDCVRNRYLWGRFSGSSQNFSPYSGMSRSYREDEMAKAVEAEVRTWMHAGKTAADLLASEKLP